MMSGSFHVAVQTVFEGFETNTEKAAKTIVKRYKLESIPMGQSGTKKSGKSKLMRSFRTGGTPWSVIIGPDGKVKLNDFHIEPEKAKALIKTLKKKERGKKPAGSEGS